jgi:hypothetical protein
MSSPIPLSRTHYFKSWLWECFLHCIVLLKTAVEWLGFMCAQTELQKGDLGEIHGNRLAVGTTTSNNKNHISQQF